MGSRFKTNVLAKIGYQLRHERMCKKGSLERISFKTDIPLAVLDRIECGICDDWELIVKLADFYGKKIKFTLVDGVPLEYLEEEAEIE